MPRVTGEMMRLVITAKMPDTDIAWPEFPSVRCKSEAIGVSRLTGMNSDAMSVETHSVRASTAPHRAGRDERASSAF